MEHILAPSINDAERPLPPRGLRALLVSDSEEDALLLVEALQRGGYAPDWARIDSEAALRAALDAGEWDVVFCDYATPGCDALHALQVLREKGDTLTAIVVSGPVGAEVAVEAMRIGANDFILKEDWGGLAASIERELRAKERRDERAAAAAELRQCEASQREQAALLDHAQDAILVQDLEGKILYWNKSAERVFGWNTEEAVGSRAQDLLYDDVAPYAVALERTLARGAWIGDVTKCVKGGGHVLIEGRWTLVRDEAGQPKVILAINTDITERRALEAQLFRAQRLESIGTLAGGIAHDLNNVLGPIILGVELLNQRMTDPRDLRLLNIIDQSGKRGAEMVKQVVYFARGVEGTRGLVSPVQLIHELARTIEDTLSKSILVELDTPVGTWKTPGDRTQLYQVLLNLCLNARDAMPEGGTLRITTANRVIDEQFAEMQGAACPGPYVVITVADTGTGMSPEVAKKVFEAFFTTKGPDEGTGLGLSTTRAIVKNHGGFITVQSEVGKGATFEVNLPAELGSEIAEPRLVAEPIAWHGSRELILVIDDEAAIRAITAETLEAFGYRVICACDGAEGVAKYAQHIGEIAAVITDMMMPVMDGRATIRVLLKMNPNLKIIAASGSSTPGPDAETADGAKYFLPKPYTAETLLRTLHELLHG